MDKFALYIHTHICKCFVTDTYSKNAGATCPCCHKQHELDCKDLRRRIAALLACKANTKMLGMHAHLAGVVDFRSCRDCGVRLVESGIS